MGNTERNPHSDDPAFYEKFYFTPGDLGYKVFQTKFAKIGVLICWDQWYARSFRITALMGADIMFLPYRKLVGQQTDDETNQDQYNAGKPYKEVSLWEMEFLVVSVNRVGFEQDGAMKFSGRQNLLLTLQGKLFYLALSRPRRSGSY